MSARKQIRWTIEPTSLDWARLAAFIDGEGCITLDNKLQPNGRRLTYLRIIVSNTSPALILWLRDTFGGGTTRKLGKPSSEQWAQCYCWQVSNAFAAEILQNCMPYFIIKTEQARVGIAHQVLLRAPGRHGHSLENLRERQMLRDALSLLKNAPSRRKDLRPTTPTIN